MARTVVTAFSARLGALVSGLRREPRPDPVEPKSGVIPLTNQDTSVEERRAILQELLVEDFTSEEDRWTWG